MVLKLEGAGKISGAVADQLVMNSDGTVKAAVTPSDTADPKSLATLGNVLRDSGETQRGMPLVATPTEARLLASKLKMLTPGGLAEAFSGSRLTVSGNTLVERMPGGLIRQYGYTTTPGGVSFPVPFPGSLFGITLGVVNTMAADATATITLYSPTGFNWAAFVAGAAHTGNSVGIFWCATGTWARMRA